MDNNPTPQFSYFNPISPDQVSANPFGTLTVTSEKFLEMAALQLPDEMVKNLRGLDYLNVAHAIYLLRVHFPTLSVCFVEKDGMPFVDIEESDRGTMLGVYLKDSRTGACTAVHWFPVMGNAAKQIKPAELEADARKINDNMARATVKCISYNTGIAFSIYSRIELGELEAIEGDMKAEKAKSSKSALVPFDHDVDDDEDYDYDEDDGEEDDDEEQDEEPVVRRRGAAAPRTSALPSRRSTTSRLPRR